MQRTEGLVHLLLLICAILVSTSFIVGEHIARVLDPAALTLIRFVLAVVFLLPIIACRHGFRITPRDFCRYGLVSACLVVFFWCMFAALRLTTALHTSVLFTLVPGVSALYASLLVRERLGLNKLAALVVGLVGAMWVIFRGDIWLLLSLSWNRGDALFFIGCLAMGLYTPLIRLVRREEPMEVMTFWILVSGSLWLLPIGGPELLRLRWDEIEVTTWLWVGYLSVFTTVVTFYLTQYGVARLGPTRTMAYSYLYPALVLVIKVIIGHGWPEVRVIPGVGIIVAAMVVLQAPLFSTGDEST